MKKVASIVVGVLALVGAGLTGPAPTSGATRATRSTAEYTVPQVALVREDGKKVWLPDELNDGRPVVMNFIFTTCSSICPLLSETFARLQTSLGAERDKVHIVSITIDPEEDTPARLSAYAKRYKAGPEWRHYTGTMQAIVATAKAFNAYRGDKMSHTPLTLIRKTRGGPWIRFDGFATADDLLRELKPELVASK